MPTEPYNGIYRRQARTGRDVIKRKRLAPIWTLPQATVYQPPVFDAAGGPTVRSASQARNDGVSIKPRREGTLMAMTMTGEATLPAGRSEVWALLNDPAVLKACIPGCQSLDRAGDNGFAAVAKVKIGPVAATFKGKVELSNVVPETGYTIAGEGEGGIAGFAKGAAKVLLADVDGGATLLKYDVEAHVGGKIAQLGSRLIDSVAKTMADKFFTSFAEAAAARATAAQPSVETVAAAEAVAAPPPASVEPAPTLACAGSRHAPIARLSAGRRREAPRRRYAAGVAAYNEEVLVEEDMGMVDVSMTVNGRKVSAELDPRTLLAQFLRENLRLTGTHIGCDTSQCGACVVHVDGEAVKSCAMLAASCDGAEVTTIEGLAQNGKLHPMQQSFQDNHGLQCGFCTPGMIMAAIDLVNREGPNLDEATIRHGLEGNICRCTGYHNIVKAVAQGAREMTAAAPAKAAE